MRRWIVTAMLTALPMSVLAQDAARKEAPIDPLQAERHATVPKIRPWPIDWFQPQELVRGRTARRTTPAITGRSIAPAALAKARDYAFGRNDTQALLIWRDGKIELAEWGMGAKPYDRLNTYYMHYSVLSLLYGVALQEGKIGSIDDPVGKYIAEWRNDPRGAITLRNLLNMQAGLEMYFDNTDPRSKAARLFMGADTTTPAFEYALAEPQGQTFAYNYLIPEILGIALERAIGMRYADYLSSRLWRPIGNADATVWLDRPAGRPHYNSSLFATAEDWLNVGKLILDNGKVGARQVIPAKWIATMKTPASTNPNYGMLWLGSPHQPVRRYAKDVNYTVAASAPYRADDVLYLDGYGGQRVYVVPSQRLVIVRIGVTRRDWDDAALPNAVLDGLGRR